MTGVQTCALPICLDAGVASSVSCRRGQGTYAIVRHGSPWKIIQGEHPPELQNGTIFLVGTSAKGLKDLHFTAVGSITPGIEIHAQVIEQLLTGHFLTRPDWIMGLEVLIVFSGSLLMGWLGFKRAILVSLSLLVSFEVALFGSSWLLLIKQGILLDSFTPGALIMSVFICSSVLRHVQSEYQNRWIRNVFSRYVSPNLVNYLIAHPQELALSGQRLECSFIMTDLANSTQLMESAEPTVIASYLNAYLDQMITLAFKYDGTLTRIIGDGIVIMFSAPVLQTDHRQRAVMCALEMHHFAQQYLAEIRARGVEFCETRIGVNTGMVLVGNFGGQAIFDYRALGDPINTASRMESVNRYLGTWLCVSENTLQGCQNVISRPIGRLLLKGKKNAFMAYEPLGINTETAPVEPDSAYEQAYLALAQNQSQQALLAFESLLQFRPFDRLVAFHVARLQRGEQGELIVLTDK